VSVVGETAGAATVRGPSPALRLLVATLAVTGVAFALWALFALLGPDAPPPKPVRNPFGAGLREAAPEATGISGWILAVQGQFYRSLQGAVSALKQGGGAIWPLMALGFAYGVFHAAGPGHGKAVISAYLVASERALAKGFALSLAAALVQALVAIAIVSVLSFLLGATAAMMSRTTGAVEMASFVAVAVLGLFVTWRKAGSFLTVASLARDPGAMVAPVACDHVHLPGPDVLERARRRELAGVVLAAGIRPCAGAIVVLVFSLSQGLFAAGIAATFAMALGTALTTGAIATLAVFMKSAALRLAGGRGAMGALAVVGLELLAAAFVLVVGAALVAGLWTSTTGS
jgi:nickel/cobalt exporter